MKKVQQQIGLLLVLLLVLVSGGLQLVHDHPPSLEEPIKCPVHILQTNLSTIILQSVELPDRNTAFGEYSEINTGTLLQPDYIGFLFRLRAPPRL